MLPKYTEVLSMEIRDTELTALLEKARSKFNVPGISIVVFNSGSILNHCVSGLRRIDGGTTISKQDYFHIGSTSKSILAVLAGKQVELGNISWDTKCFELFTDLKDSALTQYHQITLEDLFLCKAGIKPFTDGSEQFPELTGSDEVKKYGFARWLFDQMPASQKASDGKFSFVYSNAGYALIAMMLEKASGESYEHLLSGLLNEYLHADFIFGWPNNYDSSQPWGHGNFGYNADGSGFELNKNKIIPFEPDHIYKLNDLIRPAGDISMKPIDFAAFTQLFLKGMRGMDTYITSATLKYIGVSKPGFSLGVGNSLYSGKQIIGFDGSAGTFYCRGIIVPRDNMGLTIMINSGSQPAIDWLLRKVFKKHYNWWWKFWL
jgi:D-alanyl-D-alanine carboxypeptidase